MAQPSWVTPAGNFGTYTEGVAISESLVATPSTGGYTLLYTLLNGTFPDALVPFTLNSSTGIFTGTSDQVAVTTDFSFTVRVFQYNGVIPMGFTDRTFSFTVEGPTAPTFITSAGALYPGPTYLPDSTWSPFQILVDNPDPNTEYEIRLISGSLPDGLEINSAGLIRGYATPPATPTQTFNFELEVISESGLNTRSFSITVVQQTTATRYPAITNTTPPSYTIPITSPNAPYYIPSTGNIGTVSQNNFFMFKILGDSFKSGSISYSRLGSLPPGITDNTVLSNANTEITIVDGGLGYTVGDTLTVLGSSIGGVDVSNDLYLEVTSVVVGTGNILAIDVVYGSNPDSNDSYNSINVTGGSGTGAIINLSKINPSWISGTITNNPSSLVATYNFSFSAINYDNGLSSGPQAFSIVVVAQNDNVPFDPSVTWITNSNLGSINNGSISSLSLVATSAGGIPLQYTLISGILPPDLTLLSTGEIVGKVAFNVGPTLSYTFTVQAQNVTYSQVSATKTFTLTVNELFPPSQPPYDNLYIRALLSPSDRVLLDSLLTDTDIFPPDYIYRPTDIYFGKATDVVYQHMYGVKTSSVLDYISAVQKNHYRKQIVLGPVKTAIAKDQDGNIQYEVVYSEIIDNLINQNGISISKEIVWPRPIPNYSSALLYPNSLPNMRLEIADELGQDTQSAILPAWMTSQQANGSSLGFTQAWVICYCKPGYSEIIKNNIVSPLQQDILVSSSSALNNSLECTSTEKLYPGMMIQFTGVVFGNVTTLTTYYILNILNEKEFTISTALNSVTPVTLINASGEMYLHHITWSNKLNELTFQVDRFEIDKSLTFDWNTGTNTWATTPSGVVSDDDEDQYIYFKKNILS